MRKFIGLMLLLGLFSLAAVAQENYSKAEVFGGYQYTRFDGGVNANGFNGAITGNLNHWFGVAADFSGAYKNVSGVDTKTYTYTFGPQVAMRRGGAFTPFAHALFGGFHSSASASGISAFVRRISLFGFGQWHLGERQRLCLYAGRWRGCESCSGYLGALAPV